MDEKQRSKSNCESENIIMQRPKVQIAKLNTGYRQLIRMKE